MAKMLELQVIELIGLHQLFFHEKWMTHLDRTLTTESSTHLLWAIPISFPILKNSRTGGRHHEFLDIGCKQQFLASRNSQGREGKIRSCVTSWTISVHSYAIYIEERIKHVSAYNGRHHICSPLKVRLSVHR